MYNRIAYRPVQAVCEIALGDDRGPISKNHTIDVWR